MAATYNSIWLEDPDEVFVAFKDAGLDHMAAVRWLAQAHRDRGFVKPSKADPARDLFRADDFFPDGIAGGRVYEPYGLIDWETLTVQPSGIGSVPIFLCNSVGISRKLLAVLLPDSDYRARRYSSDKILVNEAVKGIKMGLYSNAHQAAKKLADRAEGPATLTSKIDRLEKAIRKFLTVDP